jgi:Ca2+-transporting ATPase
LTKTISDKDVVVGDIIKLETGMRIPADCILIEGTDVACDESSQTGEVDEQPK